MLSSACSYDDFAFCVSDYKFYDGTRPFAGNGYRIKCCLSISKMATANHKFSTNKSTYHRTSNMNSGPNNDLQMQFPVSPKWVAGAKNGAGNYFRFAIANFGNRQGAVDAISVSCERSRPNEKPKIAF